MDLSQFFAELKRRNVYKVAVAYVVAGWAVAQGIAQILPVFDVPNWVVRLAVLFIISGLPVALGLAWAFEITPEGIKRTADARDAAQKETRSRAWIYVVLAGVLLSLLLFLWGRFELRRTASVPGLMSPKSIAVLPFENLSSDSENAYFADGIQEEILTRLTRIRALKVISRTSTQKYKSAPDNLREIAHQLGVRYILEGTVQKTGEQVRITAQLISALNDSHLWADSYDRQLIDMFGVESDVARNIASALETKLTGSEEQALAERPTSNPEAYQLYLKARFFWNKRTAEGLKTAAEYFEQAAAADPAYPAAQAGLSETYVLIPLFSAVSAQEYFQKAGTAAFRAIQLDESSAEAHTTLGLLYCLGDLELGKSEREFRRAIELNHNYATAHHWFGHSLLVALGQFDEAIREGRDAVELDPLSLVINADLGSTYTVARRYDEAIEQLRRTIALDNNFAYAHWNLGQALFLKGDLPGAIAEYEKARALNEDPEVLGLLGCAYARAGEREKALDLLRKLDETAQRQYVRRYLFALIHVGLGDNEKAVEYLEQADQVRENIDLSWLKVDPLLDPLRDLPRFATLVSKVFGGNVEVKQ